MSKKISFRGKLSDATNQSVNLKTADGSVGYKILKFELFPSDPTATNENIVKIFSVAPTGTSTAVDFSDTTMLAVAMWSNSNTSYANPDDMIVVFDTVIFNQDITLSHRSSQGGLPINYHLELETIKLDGNENAVATLKNIKNRS
jgi:hypothetical protein